MRRLAMMVAMLWVLTETGTAANSAVSPAFVLNTLTPGATSVAVSGAFTVNTRGPAGQGGSQASGGFLVDTRNATVTGLTISGEAFVDVGPSYAYTVKAHFSDGSENDVTAQVRWSDSGWPFHAIRPDGTLTIIFDDPADRPLILRAQYSRPSGALTAEFAIKRGLSPAIHVFLYNPSLTFLRPEGTRFVWKLNADVSNVLNATGAVSYAWSLGGQPIPGASTANLNVEILGQPGTSTLQVVVTDAQGHTALDTRTVVINRPGLNEPGEHYPAHDPKSGKFVDSDGQPFIFYANRIQHGLVVLTHGLRGNEDDKWLRDMKNGFGARLYEDGKPEPNIAIFGWKDGAQPPLHYNEGSEDSAYLARCCKSIRSSCGVTVSPIRASSTLCSIWRLFAPRVSIMERC